eukprot:scaffold2191_cov138-Isochrysis_galbana.AAC.3
MSRSSGQRGQAKPAWRRARPGGAQGGRSGGEFAFNADSFETFVRAHIRLDGLQPKLARRHRDSVTLYALAEFPCIVNPNFEIAESARAPQYDYSYRRPPAAVEHLLTKLSHKPQADEEGACKGANYEHQHGTKAPGGAAHPDEEGHDDLSALEDGLEDAVAQAVVARVGRHQREGHHRGRCGDERDAEQRGAKRRVNCREHVVGVHRRLPRGGGWTGVGDPACRLQEQLCRDGN